MNDQDIDILLERFDKTLAPLQRQIVAKLMSDHEVLSAALRELVTLQSHYAVLLNGYDGGQRIAFASAQEWIDRLAFVGKIPKDHKCKV